VGENDRGLEDHPRSQQLSKPRMRQRIRSIRNRVCHQAS
jgi:hypothetical protein